MTNEFISVIDSNTNRLIYRIPMAPTFSLYDSLHYLIQTIENYCNDNPKYFVISPSNIEFVLQKLEIRDYVGYGVYNLDSLTNACLFQDVYSQGQAILDDRIFCLEREAVIDKSEPEEVNLDSSKEIGWNERSNDDNIFWED